MNTEATATAIKDRERHIEFHRNYCTHYAPAPGSIARDYCAIGCGSLNAMDRARKAGEPNMSPCIGGHKASDALALCPQWERRSLESADRYADAIERSMKRMTLVMPVVNAWRKCPPVGKSEIIRCPVCDGRLHLSQSSYNGHVYAKCETKDCASWME
jgi:hypothetical protein